MNDYYSPFSHLHQRTDYYLLVTTLQTSKLPTVKGLAEKLINEYPHHIESTQGGLDNVNIKRKHAALLYREHFVQNYMVLVHTMSISRCSICKV